MDIPTKFNPRLYFYLIAIVLSSFQFGYHLVLLNTSKEVIGTECSRDRGNSFLFLFLTRCILLSEEQYSWCVSIFGFGGLIGSILASYSLSRKKAIFYTCLVYFIGSSVGALSTSYEGLFLSRFLVGIGGGLSLVVVPIYLSELAPIEFRGRFGVMNQMGIVLGILISQISGLVFTNDGTWRFLFGFAALLASIQMVCIVNVPESPKVIGGEAGEEIMRLMYGTTLPINVEEERLSLRNVMVVARPQLIMIVALQTLQQLSGINAIMYYSTAILATAYPNKAAFFSVLISVVNVLVTIMNASLIDTRGRKKLLLWSCTGMFISSFGMLFNVDWITLLSIISFVSAFAVGLGPIPFLLTGELFETKCVDAAGSVAISVNWTLNFVIGIVFLWLKNVMGQSVFLIFGISQLVGAVFIQKYLPETKGKSVEENARALRNTGLGE